MSTLLRDARPGDETLARRLLEMALAPYGLSADYALTDADLRDIQASYLRAGGAFRILEEAGQGIGMYGLHRLDPLRCELRKMYLEPACKGRGFGRLLMQDAFAQATGLGFAEMLLETNSALVEAIGMYRRFGFEVYEPEHLAARCDVGMRKRL